MTTSRRLKAIITLYTFLGITLSAIGVLAAWLSNSGIVSLGNNPTYRIVALFLSLALVAIGTHLAIAGIASLRTKS